MKLRKASITCTFPGKTRDIRAYTNSKNKTKLYMCYYVQNMYYYVREVCHVLAVLGMCVYVVLV